MAKPRLQYNTEEIDEILDLYAKSIKKSGKLLTEFKSKTISKFNEKLVNDRTKRRNGEIFNLYRYNFWAGKNRSTGEYNYGKKIIIQRNEELLNKLTKANTMVEMQDVINIINRNIKTPNKMTELLCIYLKKEKDKVSTLINENIELTNQVRNLKSKNQMLTDIYTNLFFNSQNPNNSLYDMLSLKKMNDKFICEELEHMYDDGLERFKILANLDFNQPTTYTKDTTYYLQNLVNLEEEKRKLQKIKDLEDEGF